MGLNQKEAKSKKTQPQASWIATQSHVIDSNQAHSSPFSPTSYNYRSIRKFKWFL